MLIVTFVYCGTIALKVECWCNKLEVRDYTNCTNFKYNLDTNYTTQDIKNLIDSDFDIGLYFYKETPIKYAGGLTYFQLRLIKVDTMSLISKPYYAYVMAHELTHLKYYNGNECWTEFMSWKYLYESENEFLHNVGLWKANCITQMHSQDAYDCGWWILEYMLIEQAKEELENVKN